jgi:hypothetical protein
VASFPGPWTRDSHIPTLWLNMTRPHPNASELIQGAPPLSNLCKSSFTCTKILFTHSVSVLQYVFNLMFLEYFNFPRDEIHR